MAVNEQGVFVVETPDELKAWMREFHENCDNVWTIPSCAVYAMLQFVEGWLDCQWRPIETAPKDGTPILVSARSGQYVVTWLTEDETDQGFTGWYVTDNKHGPFSLRGPSPTHWMPLPAPPEEPAHV